MPVNFSPEDRGVYALNFLVTCQITFFFFGLLTSRRKAGEGATDIMAVINLFFQHLNTDDDDDDDL